MVARATAFSAHVRRRTGFFATSSAPIIRSVIAGPTLAADASNGERLAERWCAACHVVSLDQRQASSDAPPFASIAKRPNFGEAGMMTFLLDPHAKMPNMNLTRFEAADIAAYISKLR